MIVANVTEHSSNERSLSSMTCTSFKRDGRSRCLVVIVFVEVVKLGARRF